MISSTMILMKMILILSCGGTDCADHDENVYPDSNGKCVMGSSCLEILEEGRTTESGTYFLDSDGIDTGMDPLRLIAIWKRMVVGGQCATPQMAKLYIYQVSCLLFKNLEHRYRSDCRSYSSDILYHQHDTAEKAWFTSQSGVNLTIEGLGYSATYGSMNTLLDANGVATTDYDYQLNICDSSWMHTGIMMSGFTGCIKTCILVW